MTAILAADRWWDSGQFIETNARPEPLQFTLPRPHPLPPHPQRLFHRPTTQLDLPTHQPLPQLPTLPCRPRPPLLRRRRKRTQNLVLHPHRQRHAHRSTSVCPTRRSRRHHRHRRQRLHRRRRHLRLRPHRQTDRLHPRPLTPFEHGLLRPRPPHPPHRRPHRRLHPQDVHQKLTRSSRFSVSLSHDALRQINPTLPTKQIRHKAPNRQIHHRLRPKQLHPHDRACQRRIRRPRKHRHKSHPRHQVAVAPSSRPNAYSNAHSRRTPYKKQRRHFSALETRICKRHRGEKDFPPPMSSHAVAPPMWKQD